MIFVDASALIAILAQEDDGEQLFARLERDDIRLFSAVSRWETIVGLRRSYRLDLDVADRSVRSFFNRLAFKRVPIGEREEAMAIEAARRFGKGRHPAALNMGDCFAYACATSVGAQLLYKGNDFALTDLA